MPDNTIKPFYPKSQQALRAWLQKYHDKKDSAWFIFYKKNSGKPTVMWTDAVDEALCFGWVDSKRVSIDEEKFMQFFTRRKKTSTWSKINKEKVDRLIKENLMMPAGLKCIDIAKQNGSWTSLDTVEAFEVPEDLKKAFGKKKNAFKFFSELSPSVRKIILHWLAFAKRAETREKRISEIVQASALKKRPNGF